MIAATYIFSSNALIEWLILMAIAVPCWLYWNATAKPSRGTSIGEDGSRGLSDEGGPVRSYGGGGGSYDGGGSNNGFSDFMDDGAGE